MTAGGEFPPCFCDAWKRLVCSKQWFPKAPAELYARFGRKSVTASSSALPHRCWLPWLSLLPEQPHNVPCPPVGNHKFLLPWCQTPTATGFGSLVLEELCSEVSGRLTKPRPSWLALPFWESLEGWMSLGLSWWVAPHSLVVPHGIRTPSSRQHQ